MNQRPAAGARDEPAAPRGPQQPRPAVADEEPDAAAGVLRLGHLRLELQSHDVHFFGAAQALPPFHVLAIGKACLLNPTLGEGDLTTHRIHSRRLEIHSAKLRGQNSAIRLQGTTATTETCLPLLSTHSAHQHLGNSQLNEEAPSRLQPERSFALGELRDECAGRLLLPHQRPHAGQPPGERRVAGGRPQGLPRHRLADPHRGPYGMTMPHQRSRGSRQ
mmetsp:Transcript_89269/g.288524  ORF Transcript_89269/g.288524 Transcript_89269/m.288524 type:complete len:219 (+) Transcript_89269:171-827(+)